MLLLALFLPAVAPAEAGARSDLDVDIKVIEYSSPGGAGAQAGSLRHVLEFEKDWTSGTTANTADLVYSLNDVGYTTTPVDYDLRGSLASKLDASAVVAVEVVCVIVKNESTTGDLHVGGDANSIPLFGAAADYLVVKPGGLLVLCSGADPAYATTAGTGDILQITASAGTVVGDVIVLGRSA